MLNVSDTLRFLGCIVRGTRQFAITLVIPGSDEIPSKIRDWPDRIYPGSLNIRVEAPGFPAKYIEIFGSASVNHLDTRRFLPEAEIPHDAIGNNALRPTAMDPDRGNAQIWRADLTIIDSGMEMQCWVLRRIGSEVGIGSKVGNVIECVSGKCLWNAMSLNEGDRVELELQGRWDGIWHFKQFARCTRRAMLTLGRRR